MESSRWAMYAVVATISILSPGPAVLLAISNSVRFGLRRVMYSSLGNVIGVMCVSALAMLGLGAVLKSSAFLFGILKLIGAGYLIFLGIKQWNSKGNIFTRTTDALAEDSRSNWQLFTQGITLALTNPKAILFFTALFPQFIDGERALVPQFAILTGTFMTISFCSLMMYGLLARTTRHWFTVPRHARWFNRVSGGLFVLLGFGLLRLKNVRG
jgi:homoserine/homoserine lactone efflux protein